MQIRDLLLTTTERAIISGIFNTPGALNKGNTIIQFGNINSRL